MPTQLPTDPSRPTIVEAWSPSCVACRAMQPDLEAVARDQPEVEVVRVDVVANPSWARERGVLGTPTLIGFRDGAEVFRHTGRRDRAELRSLFAAVQGEVDTPRVGRFDRILRVAAGLVLTVLGAVSGPTWPLVAVGIVVLAVGVIGWSHR